MILLLLRVAFAAAPNSCVECHSALAGNLAEPATAFQDDVHSRAVLGCDGCHGGDPTSTDPQLAMSPKRGFRGRPARTAIPKLCARCHSDADFMRKFNPNQPTGQFAQYQTSVHGKLTAKGDAKAAVCVDCHGAHGIRPVNHPLSPTQPLNQPQTCGKCHADSRYMALYKIATDQVSQYLGSVHRAALEERAGQSSAPACSSCHGSHGATPPQVESMAAVCGICHSKNQELYNKSPHRPVFSAMRVGGCVVCHGNHAVKKATGAMLAGPGEVCSQCHPEGSQGAEAASQMAAGMDKLTHAIERSDNILRRAQNAGMPVSHAQAELFQARQALVTAQVAVHAFDPQAVQKPVSEGLKIAAQTWQAGQAALEERRTRRIGLGISLITIAVMITGLVLAIRMIERRQAPR